MDTRVHINDLQDTRLLVNDLLDKLDNILTSIENDGEIKKFTLSVWDIYFIKHCIEYHMVESEVRK